MSERFHAEPISVSFEREPLLTKKPHCPDRFTWRGEIFEVVELLSEWRDFARRGRMARNMRPENLSRARQRGSWGVGRFYFRVRVSAGRVFEIYYDRAPRGSGARAGSWILSRELIE